MCSFKLQKHKPINMSVELPEENVFIQTAEAQAYIF
jgi:hypothetical protein